MRDALPKHLRVADPQPEKRAKIVVDRKVRVVGLSANCKKKRHSACTSLSCECDCGHGVGKEDV